MATKKYYWLKLHRDFFKRHDVKIIEAQENGKDYVLFYLKLLAESVDHDGTLRFSNEIPYDDKMLATITDTNIDIVRSSVSAFTAMGLMEKWDDGTLFMSHIDKMIGSETDGARRVRASRDRKALQCNNDVTNCNKNANTELDTELEKDIDIEGDGKKAKRKRFTPPTVDEVKEYAESKGYAVNATKFHAHYESNGWMVGRNKMKSWNAAMASWNSNDFNSTQTPHSTGPTYAKLAVCRNKCTVCGKQADLRYGKCEECTGEA